jgi:kinesin family protein 11
VHVPYRDSKLTILLTNSFKPTSKTHLLLTVSPEPSDALQTHHTLEFGSACKQVLQKPEINSHLTVAKLLYENKNLEI